MIPKTDTKKNFFYFQTIKYLTTKKLVEGVLLFLFTVLIIKEGKIVIKTIIMPLKVKFRDFVFCPNSIPKIMLKRIKVILNE